MITHNLTIALRNLLKYKTQTAISIMGLAIGFAYFALSTYWIKYEMTYDTFHRDSERIHLLGLNLKPWGPQYRGNIPLPMGNYLKENYPEVEDWCAFEHATTNIRKGNSIVEIQNIQPDSTLIQMLDIRILEGSDRFYRPSAAEEAGVAITETLSEELFGTPRAIGQDIDMGTRKVKVVAIVSDWGKHSNFPYQMIAFPVSGHTSWMSGTTMLLKLKEGTEVDALTESINRNVPKEVKENDGESFFLKPITSLRQDEGFIRDGERTVRFNHIVYFSIIGLLIIICALVNYLTLYAERFRIRRREMALRKVCGASEFSLFELLGTEQLLITSLAFGFGMVLIECLLGSFGRYTMITRENSTIYTDCIGFVGTIALLTLAVTLVSIFIIRRSSIRRSIETSQHTTRLIFRRSSLLVQLIISLAFIFCTVVIQMQLHHLRNVDTGMEYRNRAAVSLWMNVDMNVWHEKIKALPMVEHTTRPLYWPLLTMGQSFMCIVNDWDGADKGNQKEVTINGMMAGKEYFDFYEMKLLNGEWVHEHSAKGEVNLLESTANRLGWSAKEAIGKHIYSGKNTYTVVGVIKDCAYKSPTQRIPNTMFFNTYEHSYNWARGFVFFTYRPGTWEECKRLIEEMQQAEEPTKKLFLLNEEERFNEYLKSEDTLGTLLTFASVVCILISIFGIYSLVTLHCEQRRKEIAIRKINGAKVKNILQMFFREYFLLLGIASIIAFPAGYATMKPWIETYHRQTEIGILPFAMIFMGVAMIIALSIGWRIWKAANENPAEVVKNE